MGDLLCVDFRNRSRHYTKQTEEQTLEQQAAAIVGGLSPEVFNEMGAAYDAVFGCPGAVLGYVAPERDPA